jgi:membrane associated rhomboid family serine protease
MISASVGFQCPQCVAEAKASAPVIKTRLGAKAIERPYVTFVLIGLNVVAFVLTMLSKADPQSGLDQVTADYGMWPIGVALGDEYYRLATAMFLHAGIAHIAVNMLALWVIGPQLESLFGHVRYTVLYLVAGLGGSVASFWFSTPNIVGVGASGAIFGLMGAMVVVAKRLNVDMRPYIGIIAINVVIGFVFAGIDWRAHFGGLVTGVLVGLLFAYAPVKGRVAVQALGVVVIVGLLAVAVVARDSALTAQMLRIGADSIS